MRTPNRQAAGMALKKRFDHGTRGAQGKPTKLTGVMPADVTCAARSPRDPLRCSRATRYKEAGMGALSTGHDGGIDGCLRARPRRGPAGGVARHG